MRTQEYYDEYKSFTDRKKEEIEHLESSINKLKGELLEQQTAYKEFIKQGKEDEASECFSKQTVIHQEIQKNERQIAVKRDIIATAGKEKRAELLGQVKDLKSFYKDNLDKVLTKLNKAVATYNNAIDELNQLNAEYSREELVYGNMFEYMDRDERKELRAQLQLHPNNWIRGRLVSEKNFVLLGTGKMEEIK
ncbi:hypothetical protein ACEPSL_08195 [Staphylococcus pseudintermedius]|uniref:hypothetical protein n=1 Tax=Staphylococcus pseudintermedius TaxID=283734 RepID=UPI001A07A03C|nr:hypothetical protein [Staphylococcus pseudintermedius]EGQ4115428.1 hypothetical protein [Staphylococcus pseudintermedius]EJO7137849.1 hypothetical protein [Staphylococcus pseudintermedius]EJO7192197.1 hypothetical protein [Staphylococcus pseudintermedius]HBJ9571482.1 hypothetical protein [Staphylococcus pseudintermedius]HDV6283583.1 hypothetical protein [Staphylococcus pseudintermedius]